MTDWTCVLFFIIMCLLTCVQGMYLTVSGLWFADIYGVSSSGVGFTALVGGCGEAVSNIITVFVTPKMNRNKVELIQVYLFVLELILCLVLSFIFGSDVGSIVIGFIILFLLNMGYELIFLLALPICVDISPHPKLATLMILLLLAFGGIGRGLL